jgi:hypothetical protein
MYIPNYDPTYNDVYLYGAGNTGLPIALNPNCIIYGASGSYRAISTRYRDWEVQNPSIPIPPGAGITSYPNYYNNNEPLYFKINESTLGCAVHFTWFFEYGRTDNPDILEVSPPIPDVITLSKITESLSGYTGIGGAGFFNNNFSSFDNYYGFEHCFNHLNYLPGGLTFQYYSAAKSNTYYQICNSDLGLINKRDFSGLNGITGPYLKTIHPMSILDPDILKNLDNYRTSGIGYLSNGVAFEVPVENVYFWGGNDTVAPVETMYFSISSLSLPSTNLNKVSSAWPLTSDVTLKVNGSNFWSGDSSGLGLFLKNGELYGIMTAYSTGTNAINGPALCGSQLPTFYYMTQIRGVCSNYYFSNKDSIKVATTNYFTKLINELNNSKTLLNNVVQETQQ